MPNAKFEQIFERMQNLPTLPGIAKMILEAMKKEETTLNEIADILSKDPPLSAKVLKIVNSALYALPMKITSVSHAVSLLGMNTVKNLALSFSLVKNQQKSNGSHFDYGMYWKTSLIGALSSRLMARKIFPILEEQAFFVGLLQNIGMLALNEAIPNQYGLILTQEERIRSDYHLTEKQILGFDHMDIGGLLVKKWGLPEAFSVPISYHHRLKKLENEDPEIEILTKIIHLSSFFVDLFYQQDRGIFLGLIEWFVEKYEFSEKLEIGEILEQIYEQAIDIFPIFDLKVDEEKNYLQIIDEARKELIKLSEDSIAKLIEKETQVQDLEKKATRDGLTNLLNYRRFQELFEKEYDKAKKYGYPLGIIISDIDHFKSINDTYGHLAGDHILKTVAKSLMDCFRKSDIVARYGGEEFSIVLPEITLDQSLQAAEKCRKAIESLKIYYEDKEISVTVSCGVTFFNPEDDLSRKKQMLMGSNKRHRDYFKRV
jgi:diguanylate cyclase (GGDEF)-like protein